MYELILRNAKELVLNDSVFVNTYFNWRKLKYPDVFIDNEYRIYDETELILLNYDIIGINERLFEIREYHLIDDAINALGNCEEFLCKYHKQIYIDALLQYRDYLKELKRENNDFVAGRDNMFLTSNNNNINEKFFTWVSERFGTEKCSELKKLFPNIDKILQNELIIQKSVFMYADIRTIHKICNMLISDRTFNFRYKKVSDCIRALHCYEKFLNESDICYTEYERNEPNEKYISDKNSVDSELENNYKDIVEIENGTVGILSEEYESEILIETNTEEPEKAEIKTEQFFSEPQIQCFNNEIISDRTKSSEIIEEETAAFNEDKTVFAASFDDDADIMREAGSIAGNQNKDKPINKTQTKRKPANKRNTNEELSSEKVREADIKKYKKEKWNSIVYAKGFGNEMTDVIIQQMKILKSTYGSYPLGLVKISHEQYDQMKLYCIEWIKTDLSRISAFKIIVMSFYMLQFIIKEQSSSNFWSDFFLSLKSEDTPNNRKNFFRALILLCVNEDLYFCYHNGQRKVVETLKAHAIVNKMSIDKVMEGISDYYYEVMNETYSDDTALLYAKNFITLMKFDFLKDEQGNGRYIASHSFKHSCTVFEEALTDCVVNTIYNINSDRYQLDKYKETPAAFIFHYRVWKNLLQYFEYSLGKSTNQSDIARKHYTKPSLILDNNMNLILEVPQYEIPEEFNVENSDVVLKVYNGAKEIRELRRVLNVFGRFKFKTDGVEIRLPMLYKNLRFSVELNGYLIYDSSDLLKKKYIVFNNSFEEYISSKMPKEEFYLLVSNEDSTVIDCYNELKRNDKIIIYGVDAEENSEIYVNSEPVFRNNGDENIGIYFSEGKELKSVRVIKDGVMHYSWEKFPCLVIYCDDSVKISDYSITLNDNTLNLVDLFQNGKTLIQVDKWCDKFEAVRIYIKKGEEKIVWEYNLIRLCNFSVRFGDDKKYYYKEQNYAIEDITADYLEFPAIDFPIVKPLCNDGIIILDGLLRQKDVKIRYKVPVISWRLSEKFNSNNNSIYIYEKELAENHLLSLEVPLDKYDVRALGQSRVYSLVPRNHKVDLSSFKSHSDEYTDIGITFKGEQIKLFEIIHKPCIREFFIQPQDSGKMFRLQYKLFGNCSMIVTAYNSNNSFSYEVFRSDNSFDGIIETGLPDGAYKLKIELEEADEFGFDVTRRLVETRDIFVGDLFEVYCSTLRGMKKELKIKSCIIDGEEVPVYNFYLKKVQCRVSEYMYFGKAYRYDIEKKTLDFKPKEFKRANPICITIISNDNGVLTVTITDKDNDGFLYHKGKGFIIHDYKGIKDYDTYAAPDLFYIDTREVLN